MESNIPLLNIPFIELTRRAFFAGNISLKGMVLLPVYYLSLVLVMPIAFLQNLFFGKRLKKTVITKSPVFILGHFRSGTTYLHKLMATDKRFGYIKYYDIICPNSSLLFGDWLKVALQLFINRLKIKTSFFNDTIPVLDEPAEEERFLINKGSAYTDYWRFVFPLHWNKSKSCAQRCTDENYYKRWSKEYLNVLKLAAFKSKGKQLLSKSPQNTERIKYLLQIFPDAKFIYISRNPYHVFYSMRNLWQRALRKFCLQNISDKQLEEIIFNHYSQLLDAYEKDKELIPAGNLIEIRYEELESTPVAVLQEIYSTLSIRGFEKMRDALIKKLQKEKGYSKFHYEYDGATFKRIEKRWGKYICLWRKQVPDVALRNNTKVQRQMKSVLAEQRFMNNCIDD